MVLSRFHGCMDDMMSMRPSRLLGQQFGVGLTSHDLLRTPMVHQQELLPSHYFRPWRMDNQEVGSTVHCDKDKFQVTLDVQQFSPEEIKVKVVDSVIVVEGKHEEKEDEHGYISRHFVRKYFVPEDYIHDAVGCSMSSDGVLTISAPRVKADDAPKKVIPIKIKSTGPHKAIKEPNVKE